jgi:RNA polymerase sigma factor (sigma-70 family)
MWNFGVRFGHLVDVTPATDSASGDAALWQQAAVGQHEAFGVLFDRHSEVVYNYLFRRTADWSAAEDLTAAVFLQAWRRRGQVVFDGDSALPWLLGVARLLLRNTVRARMRYQAALSRAGAEPVVPPAGLGDPADLITGRLDGERQMAAVRQSISRLPRHQREVIELCVFAGLDHQAAAISIGVSVGTVKSRLHRARQRLRSELREPGSGEPRNTPRTVREMR